MLGLQSAPVFTQGFSVITSVRAFLGVVGHRFFPDSMKSRGHVVCRHSTCFLPQRKLAFWPEDGFEHDASSWQPNKKSGGDSSPQPRNLDSMMEDPAPTNATLTCSTTTHSPVHPGQSWKTNILCSNAVNSMVSFSKRFVVWITSDLESRCIEIFSMIVLLHIWAICNLAVQIAIRIVLKECICVKLVVCACKMVKHYVESFTPTGFSTSVTEILLILQNSSGYYFVQPSILSKTEHDIFGNFSHRRQQT